MISERRSRLGRGLHSRRDIRRIAEHLARRVDHDRAGLETDTGGKFWRAGFGVALVELGERALDGERGAHRPLGVVLLRLRIAEENHQPIAKLLQHMAA
jgi:hypothetical protein